jgi:epoxide hydrolase-like predicted phosphatase
MKTLVLDIGGVFYPGSGPDEAYWARWAGPSAIEPEELSRRFWHGPDIELANVGAISAEDYYARSSSRLGISIDVVRAMVLELFVGEVNYEFAAFVRTLRAAGVPVSALTNSWSSQSELKARTEFRDLFDQVISSADVGTTKPGGAIYRIAMERLGLGHRDLVFVDDTARNVEVASALGWTAIQFVSTAQAIADISRVFGVGPEQ